MAMMEINNSILLFQASLSEINIDKRKSEHSMCWFVDIIIYI